MQCIKPAVRLALGKIELAPLEGGSVAGIVEARPMLEVEQARELRQKLTAALAHRGRELGVEIGKVQKRCRCPELLTLEEHRRGWHQQHQGGHGSPAAGAGQLMAAQSTRRIGHLIVVLQIADESRCRQPPGRHPAPLLLPGIMLSLKQVAVLARGDEFLRFAAGVAVVRLGAARQRHHHAVVKVVVPHRVEAVAAQFERPNQLRFLCLVLGDDDDRPLARAGARGAPDFREDVL